MKDWLNIDKLEYNTYDEYKDSKIEWLGYIPSHYDTKKLKQIVNIKKGNTIEQFDDEKSNRIPLLNLDYLRNREKNYFFVNSNKSIKINKGEILIVWDGSACGEFIKTKKEGALSSTLAVLRAKNNYNVEFLYYLNYTFNDYLSKNFNGMGIPHVNSTLLKKLLILIPTKKEQLVIVKFLDEKTTIIDKKIEILKKQNKLEKELEKVLINQCVTKGVDSFTKLDKNGNLIDFDNKLNRNKEEFDLYMNENGYIDSKIEWLGYIPNHFKINRIKDLILFVQSGTTPSSKDIKTYDDLFFNWVTPSDLKQNLVENTNKKINQYSIDSNQVRVINENCILYSTVGEIGKIGYSNKPITTNQQITSLITNKKVLMKYFYYLLLNNKNYIRSFANESTLLQLNNNKLINIPNILFSINKKEQLEIVKFLDNKTQILEQKRIKREKEITLLEEYKKTLINDVVTGKIKVIKD